MERPFGRAAGAGRRGRSEHIACGRLASDVISVVFTERAGTIRIISARKARHHERKAFEDHACHS
ncbi:MAG: BrnT family toxin [Alphaproteobacteria bacterium]|nr:BrnT family toxin [Alphaproteobacteria bacterium]